LTYRKAYQSRRAAIKTVTLLYYVPPAVYVNIMRKQGDDLMGYAYG